MAALVNDDRIPNEISNIVEALNIANRKLISKSRIKKKRGKRKTKKHN